MIARSLLAALVAATLTLPVSRAGAQEADRTAEWLPPDGAHAIEALDASPRHGEWAMVRLENGDSVRSWVVYPERSDPAPVVVVIHEIFGLTAWIRSVADRLAAEGFIAIAPDLLTMHDIPTDENGDPARQPAVEAIRGLDEDAVHRQVRAVAEHAMALPAAREMYAIMGFCWGGSTTFEHATRYEDLLAAVVYYGSSPSEEALARVQVPVVGHYGGDDARVNATLPRAEEVLGSRFVPRVYEGAGHGFLRQQDGRDGANLAASRRAWPYTVGVLHGAVFRHDRDR